MKRHASPLKLSEMATEDLLGLSERYRGKASLDIYGVRILMAVELELKRRHAVNRRIGPDSLVKHAVRLSCEAGAAGELMHANDQVRAAHQRRRSRGGA